jgi:hypothetical protein
MVSYLYISYVLLKWLACDDLRRNLDWRCEWVRRDLRAHGLGNWFSPTYKQGRRQDCVPAHLERCNQNMFSEVSEPRSTYVPAIVRIHLLPKTRKLAPYSYSRFAPESPQLPFDHRRSSTCRPPQDSRTARLPHKSGLASLGVRGDLSEW